MKWAHERLSGGWLFKRLLPSIALGQFPSKSLLFMLGCNDRFLFCSVLLHFSSFCLFVGHLSASAGLFACGSLLVNWAHCPGMVIQHFDGLWKSPIVRLDQAWVAGTLLGQLCHTLDPDPGCHDDKGDMTMSLIMENCQFGRESTDILEQIFFKVTFSRLSIC